MGGVRPCEKQWKGIMQFNNREGKVFTIRMVNSEQLVIESEIFGDHDQKVYLKVKESEFGLEGEKSVVSIKNWYAKMALTTKRVTALPSHEPNTLLTKGGGSHGGSCRCPDGQSYEVG